MLLMRVSLFSLFAITAVVATGVAPGDEESDLCPRLRGLGTAPTPVYSPTMRILMDSWNYWNLLPNRTGAVWQQVDNDVNNPAGTTTNWIQQTNTPCDQFVQVCGFPAGMQSNWLITQLINRTVNGTLLPQVSVLIEFELQDCDITLNCQRTFNTHVLEMSEVDPAAARITSNYRQVSRVSPDITTGARVNETVHINLNTGNSSFYFAIQDETSCIVVTRVLVFYSVCPKQTSNLIHYPEIVAPRAPTDNQPGGAPIPVTASCVENAIAENDRPPVVFCSPGGTWTKSGNGCQCVPGHSVNGAGSCSHKTTS